MKYEGLSLTPRKILPQTVRSFEREGNKLYPLQTNILILEFALVSVKGNPFMLCFVHIAFHVVTMTVKL